MTYPDAYHVMLQGYQDVLDIKQVCEILKISTKTGYRLLKDGKIQNLEQSQKKSTMTANAGPNSDSFLKFQVRKSPYLFI